MQTSTEPLLAASFFQPSDNLTIQEMIDDFICYLLIEKGSSPHTIDAYKGDLLRFSKFCWIRQVISINNLDYQFFFDFQKSLKVEGLAESSRRRTFEAIKSLFKFLRREGYSKINPSHMSCFVRQKIQQKLPDILSVDEVFRLLNAPFLKEQKYKLAYRHAAIIELLYGSGLRISEALMLKNQDIRKGFIRVKGKGEKYRLVPTTSYFIKALELYRQKCKRGLYLSENDYVFTTKKGTSVCRVSVFRVLRKFVKSIGSEKNISPHSLRHSCATHMLDNGANIRVIQDLLGHSDISTTGRYLHLSIVNIKKKFKDYHPRYTKP